MAATSNPIAIKICAFTIKSYTYGQNTSTRRCCDADHIVAKLRPAGSYGAYARLSANRYLPYKGKAIGVLNMKVLIAGGGIAGLTAAISLALRGASVDILEQSDRLGDVGAGIQLSANAMHVMRKIGLAEQLEQTACEPISGTLRQFKTGKPYFSTPLKHAHQQRYGAKYLHIHRADLIAALYEKAQSMGVTLHLGQRLASYNQDMNGITAISHSGQAFTAGLLIGADGIHSCVRDAILKKYTTNTNSAEFTHQVAWRGLVPSDRVPKALISPDANVWLGPKRHFVAYYLRGGDLINFIAIEERNAWTQESWTTQGNIEELRSAFADWDPAIGQLLQATQDCYLWGLFDRPPLPSWHDGRAVLIGDACHPMLPFMAQGGAVSIEDAYILADQLTTQTNLQRALKAYEAIRKPRATMVQTLSKSNAKIYHASGRTGELKKRVQFCVANAIPQIANLRLDKIYGHNVTK